MRGQERLYDIFQALAGTSNAVLSFADKLRQEAADAKLRSDELDLIYASGRFIQGLEGRSDFANFEPDWQRERDRLFGGAMRGAKNAYARRGLEQLYARYDVRQKLAVQSAAAESEKNYTEVLNENNIARVKELPLEGQRRFDMAQGIRRDQYRNSGDHKTYYIQSIKDMTDVIERDGRRLIEDAIAATADDEADPLGRIRQAVAGMDMSAYQFKVIDPNTGKEDGRNDDLIPREALREKLLKEADTKWNGYVKQVQGDNDNRLSVLYGQFKELPEGAWNAAADQAVAIINREMGGYRLSPEDRKKWIDAFQRIKKDLAENPDKAKRTMWEKILETDMAAYIQAGIRGATGDQRGMRTLYDAFDKWQEESLEKLRKAGYAGGATDMRLEFAETIGAFFTGAEKALPDQLKGSLNDAEQFVYGLYGTLANPVTSTLSEKYPGMKETIAGAVVEQLRDWLFGNDLSQMTLETASAQINAIVNAQVAGELDILDVLRKDPATGESGYKRKGGESEDALLARAAKALENRELVWTGANGNTHYALGTAEGVAEAQARLRERLAGILKAEGVAPGEIGMELTENAAERDKDAAPVFSARGKQYRFQSDGETLTLQSRAAGSDEWGAPVPAAAPRADTPALPVPHPDGSAEREQAAVRQEIQAIISANRKHAAVAPGGMDALTWRHMLDRGAAPQYLDRLRKTNRDAYEDYKRRVEAGGRR